MSEIDKKLLTYALLGSMFSDSKEEENKVKKIKYIASIPIGHRMKQVVGVYTASYPMFVNDIKDMVRIELRNKYNTTISFMDVTIESIEILE